MLCILTRYFVDQDQSAFSFVDVQNFLHVQGICKMNCSPETRRFRDRYFNSFTWVAVQVTDKISNTHLKMNLLLTSPGN